MTMSPETMTAKSQDTVPLQDRAPLPDVTARLIIRQRLFRREVVEVPVFQLDEHGGVIKTDRLFEPGDVLHFDLVLEMPFDDVRTDRLEGLVTDRIKHCSNFFYFVDFRQSSRSGQGRHYDSLDRVLELVTRKQLLKERRDGGAAGPVHSV
ncbi:hypothetical protein [Tamilnaduibacter salinus]|nr:hypothetical protein [Tamilnaduibacter salinus]